MIHEMRVEITSCDTVRIKSWWREERGEVEGKEEDAVGGRSGSRVKSGAERASKVSKLSWVVFGRLFLILVP